MSRDDASSPGACAISFADVQNAAGPIGDSLLRTPLLAAPRLSELTGADVRVKYENLQITSSFKARGALTKLLSLDDAERKAGVVAMSAGNHAQAVAWHARRLGIPATIVMPVTTPYVKVGNTEALGATVVLKGETVHEAREEAERIADVDGRIMVHPFDDPHVIAGQGTIAMEMLADAPELDCLIVPIGGGGLISGIAIAAKAIKPELEVYGVETELFASTHAALHGTEPTFGEQSLADGIAVKSPGTLTLPIIRDHVKDVIVVSEDMIEQAICMLLFEQKTMSEGAGAAGLAALLQERDRFAGRTVGLILCGGSIDPRILSSIAMRGLERDGKIVALRITIPDRPGQLGKISTILGREGANILEVSHHRLARDVPARGTSVDLMFEVKDARHARIVETALEDGGFQLTRISGETSLMG